MPGILYLGKPPNEKMSQKVEKVQKGGEGSALRIKKSTIQNLDFLIRGGEARFSGFSQM